MSPKKSLLNVGLTALALLGFSATRAADPGETPAPPGQPPAPASNPTHMVLLKTSGELLTGSITVEGDTYVLHKSGGPIPIPKSRVEKTFESVAAVYHYRRSRVDERDPDEHLKLARWCLSQNMPAEAMAELRAVLALSPKAREAKAMLVMLEANEPRARKPRVDAGLVQTGGESTIAPAPAPEHRPAEIDASAIRQAQLDLGVTRRPVIFDLPPAVAAKRAELFARDVHPLLQAACSKCHNEQYPGSFQLIEVKSRRGPSGDILRANLDASLRLVDPENPPSSELLSRSLVPHGNRPNPRPIFGGANDPRYQILAAWVKSLRVNRPADGVIQTRFAPRDPSDNGGFAVERVPGQGSSVGVVTTPHNESRITPGLDREPDVLPPSRFVPGRGMVTERRPPSADEFPTPFMVGGPRPKLNNGAPAPPPAQIPLPVAPPTVAPSDESLPALPPSSPGSSAAKTPEKAAKPKTPVKVDPEILQRALLNRNIGR